LNEMQVLIRDARVWTPNRTGPDPRSGLVQGLVQKNPNFGVGSGSGFALSWTCVNQV
jgi:hypothetical protein